MPRRTTKHPHSRAVRVALAALFVAAAASFSATTAAAFPGADGKIAYQATFSGDIWTVNPDGSQNAPLITHPAFDTEPAWSPDGTKLAFVSTRDANGDEEIFVANADGSSPVQITSNTWRDFNPAWSADGNQIVYASTSTGGNTDIWKVNATSGAVPTRLTTATAPDAAPAWSPDGRKILFQSEQHVSGAAEIYKMDPNGANQVRLTTNGTADVGAQWSSDGKLIFYTSGLAGSADIWRMNADGTQKTNLTSSLSGGQSQVTTSPSVPGSFAYVMNDVEDGIYRYFATPVVSGQDAEEAPDWQPINHDQARPKGASPIRIALVPAYTSCSSPNTVHMTLQQNGAAAPSCNPARQESSYLTVGTVGANGYAAQSTGYLRAAVICNGVAPGENPPCNTTPGDQEDGSIELSYTDVRCLDPTASGCANTLNGDYAGSLRLVTNVRVTDLNSAGHGGATVQDFPLAVDVPCIETPKEIGSDCTITTTIDSLLGPNAITEVKRAIWELQDVRLYDGGPDGDGSTESGNGVFARAGLFFP